jgi:small subunit ribosomal protein S6
LARRRSARARSLARERANLQRSAFGRFLMTLPAPTYDLVLLLDPQAEEETRTKLVADTRTAIEAQGELLRHDEWGERALAYPIDRKASAIYHLMQFHVAENALLESLDRTLRIADEALRFRIIKLAPGVPPAPDMTAGASARRSESDAAAPAPAASAPSAPAAPSAPEAPAVEDQPATELAVGEPS